MLGKVNINGIAISSYTTYRTSDNENITNLGDTVVNGSMLNVTLKGNSVTTFYANADYVPVTDKDKLKPFRIIADGELVRNGGIQADVRVSPIQGAAAHGGEEAVVFQLMKGNTPVSISALMRDITSEESVKAYFNVDPNDTLYTVKVFVLDCFDSDTAAPINLAEPVTLE